MRASRGGFWCMIGLLVAGLVFLPSPGRAARKPKGLCAAAGDQAGPPFIGIFGAFPAEMAALVAATQVEMTAEFDGRTYYVGRLDGVSVVLGLTGIGIANATNRAESMATNFELAALVFSGVAGSPNRIGDVVVPDDWVEPGYDGVFPSNLALLAVARRALVPLPAPLEKCTPVPPHGPNPTTICMPFDPAVVFGGRGSSEGFHDAPVRCIPNAGDLFGCEMPPFDTAGTTGDTPVISDMETTAVARVAEAHGLPFIGVRAVSDGAGDPLGDRGFPAQFQDYYVLAADNAGAVTRHIVAELGELANKRSARGICKLLAKHRWRKAAKRIGRLR